jgi:hypothetical protein
VCRQLDRRESVGRAEYATNADIVTTTMLTEKKSELYADVEREQCRVCRQTASNYIRDRLEVFGINDRRRPDPDLR